MKKNYLFIFVFILLSLKLYANMIYIDWDGTGDYITIQEGIDASVNGDTVLVEPGTYVENINYNGKNIIVGSLFFTTNDTSYITQTVIDGDSIASVVTFESSEDSTALFCGFTIRNGYGSYERNITGGGITIKNYSNPNLNNLYIKGNNGYFGAGIACIGSCPTLNNIIISENNACYGGGIYNEYSAIIAQDLLISNNCAEYGGGLCLHNYNSSFFFNVVISDNTAKTGGGIHVRDDSYFTNVLVINNHAENAGGIYCGSCSPTFTNVTVKNNTAYDGCGGIYFAYSSPVFDNQNLCNIYNNIATDYSYCNDLYSTEEVDIIVDTFTVLYPNEYYASPIHYFSFDILHGYQEQLDADLYVSSYGNNNNSGLSPNEPLRNIYYAYSKIRVDSLHPHNLFLQDGVYSPSSNYEIFPIHLLNYLSIIGESEPGVILDAECTANVIYSYYIDSVLLSNFTIQGGNAKDSEGGGIRCFRSSHELDSVTIRWNNAEQGGGIYCLLSTFNLSSVSIKENNATNLGGGIYCCNPSNISFNCDNRCNIYQNSVLGKECGNDIYSWDSLHIIVDTFTVLNPTGFHAAPIDNFTFDILNGYYGQIDSDLYVSPCGNNNNSGINPNEPLKTINYAMSIVYVDSLHPHIIYLQEGTYSPSTNGELFPINMVNYLSIVGEQEDQVILNAESFNRVIKLDNIINSSISNLTITGGYSERGGGIYCNDSSPIFRNINIVGNYSNGTYAFGGGVYCNNSSLRMYNVIISSNTSTTEDLLSGWARGGGIYCDDSYLLIQNAIISTNTVNTIYYAYGGGIYLTDSSVNLGNVTITENNLIGTLLSGGGIYSAYSNLTINNCILWNDTSTEILNSYPSTLNMSYTNIEGGWTGTGNIDNDPLFVDPINEDYHLASNSPCIDTGTPDTTGLSLTPWDLDGNERVWDGNGDGIAIIDMGCYEYDAPPVTIDDVPEYETGFKLHQNYPNPFCSSTTISVNLYAKSSHESQIRIYNIKGQLVTNLIMENANFGENFITWYGKDKNGRVISNGVYLYRFESKEYKSVFKKMLLIN